MIAYRREVDGLRALAVVPVILFHAGFDWFSGGFVGVDVFFVISGYLITSLILSEKQRGTFSLLDFYERRARRILPALFFVMAVCIPIAWLLLLPAHMKDFSQSLVAVSVFGSNILFWQERGYFDTDAELKPLLHTWSLAVEEQFYLLFPPLLLLVWRLGKASAIGTLAGLAFVSLGAAQWWSTSKPDAAFFLLPTRGWELLIGSLVAFYLADERRSQSSRPLAETGAYCGIALIVYAVLSYDDKTPFPSIYALVPTLGTALVILCARPATHVGQLLGTKPLVAIGLISYSAYLWHQPLFAFARHHGAAGRSTEVLVALCAVTLFLAYLTWVFVETPFRKKNLVSRRDVFQVAICGAVLFIGVGLAGHVSQGFESAWISRKSESELLAFRLLKEERAHNEQMALRGADLPAGVDCRFNVPNLTADIAERLKSCHTRYGEGVAVIGDSHAIDLYAAIATANEHLKFVVGFTRGYCRPHTALPECQYEQVREFVRQHKVFSVVLYEQAGFYLLRTKSLVAERKIFSDVPLWGHVTGVYPNEPFVEATHRYLHALSEFVPVTWFGPRVEPHFDESDIIRLGCRHDYRLRPGQAEAFADLDRYLKRRVGEAGRLRYVSQNEMLSFNFPGDFMTCDRIYWADGDHFSRAGEEYFGRRLDMPRLLSRDSEVTVEIGAPVSHPFTGTQAPVRR